MLPPALPPESEFPILDLDKYPSVTKPYAIFGDLTKFFTSPLAEPQQVAQSGKYDYFAQTNTVLHSTKSPTAPNPSAGHVVIGRAIFCGMLGLIMGVVILYYTTIIKMLTTGAILVILVSCFIIGVMLGVVFGVVTTSAIATQDPLPVVIDKEQLAIGSRAEVQLV